MRKVASAPVQRARVTAATVLTASGLILIGLLWFRDISEPLLIGALFGACYLLIGVGLYGLSRFALFMGIVTPGLRIWLSDAHFTGPVIGDVDQLLLALDALVIVICGCVLFLVRNRASA